MTADELYLMNEEIAFWEANFFTISILRKVPVVIPNNYSIKSLLTQFITERDYYSIAHRLGLLRRTEKEIPSASLSLVH
jgi:hypothetical protein